jgi:CRP/FNR family transcriptional regulator
MRIASRSNGRTLPLGPDDEACLDRHPLIGQARPEGRAALLAAATQRFVVRRGLIVQDGDPCPGLHVVLDGIVQICHVATSGRTFVFRLVRAGDSFGEEEVFVGERHPALARYAEASTSGPAPTPANASAVTDARLLVFPAGAVRSAAGADAGLAEGALAVLAGRTLAALERQQQLALESPAQRIARYLHHHAAESGRGRTTVCLDVPKVTVAHYLGTVPEVLARHLRRFEKAGVLRRRGNGVLEIVDRTTLGRWAAGVD